MDLEWVDKQWYGSRGVFAVFTEYKVTVFVVHAPSSDCALFTGDVAIKHNGSLVSNFKVFKRFDKSPWYKDIVQYEEDVLEYTKKVAQTHLTGLIIEEDDRRCD